MGDGTEGRLVWRRQPARHQDLEIVLRVLPMIYETELPCQGKLSQQPINLFVQLPHTIRQIVRYLKQNYGVMYGENTLVAAMKRVNDEINFLQRSGVVYRADSPADEERRPAGYFYKATGTLEEARNMIIALNDRRFKTHLAGAASQKIPTARLEDFLETPA